MRCVCKWFKDDVLSILRSFVIQNLVSSAFVNVWLFESIFAKLAFKKLPIVRKHIFRLFEMNLSIEPFSKAIEMNRPHSASTCARGNEGIFNIIFMIQAYSTSVIFFIWDLWFSFWSIIRIESSDMILIWLKPIILKTFVCEFRVCSSMENSWRVIRNYRLAQISLWSFHSFRDLFFGIYPCHLKPNSSKLNNIIFLK